jgi:hypothetical protein
MVTRLYQQQKEHEARATEQKQQDAIAQCLSDQVKAETRDQKIRALLCENDPEYRTLKSKLQLALVSQIRDNQIHEAEMRRVLERQERIEQEEQVIRAGRRRDEARDAEVQAKREAACAARAILHEQMKSKERHNQLLHAARSERDKQQVDEIVARIRAEDEAMAEQLQNKQSRARQEMIDFVKAREAMKAEERRQEEEEDKKMRAFAASVDERLERAKEEVRQRNVARHALGQKIAEEVKRRQEESVNYENLCLELAQQQELQKLKEREEMEARKIAQQHEECRRFMIETQRVRAQQAELNAEEERRLMRQVHEQQMKVARLAEIEQEQNRLRIEKFRRELRMQLTQKKEMYEIARQEELRKLRLEQQREEERQRILNEERRKLVLNHILAMGPEAVQYLPKGILKEGDLNYLPQDYRDAILLQALKNKPTFSTSLRASGSLH